MNDRIVRMAASLLLLCLFCLGSVKAGKLLVVPSDGSHWTGMRPLVEELGRRGNQVVVVIPEASLSMGPSQHTTTLTYPVPYTKTQLQEHVNAGVTTLTSTDLSTDLARFQSFINTMDLLNVLITRNVEGLLSNKTLMKKLQDYNFDAILTDPFEPVGPIAGEYLSIPAIYIQTSHPCGVDALGSQCPIPASYVPQAFTHFTDHMNLWQRSVNLVRTLFQPMACRRMFAHADEIASHVLQRKTSMVEIMSRAALWFVHSDFAFAFPRPLMPNMIIVGGMDSKKAKPLSQELEEFANGSGEHGFVVFTLGSMVSQLPEAKAREFFEAFRQIPQRVLWRYTGPVPENAPKNVKLMKWLPQNDLLGHPKVKAFITHGGSHGIYEGICNGVPMVMLPLFGDQGDNAQRLVSRGVAEALSIFDVTSEKLLVALRKVINDKSYKEKMTELSAIHRDRPIEPLDLAVFWTEFVMRHKGADHLRTAAHELNWIQYHSLDVIGFLILILVTVIFVTVKSCMFCFRKCFKKTQKKKKE
ncbi:UDP-glucuronosyltransferase 1A5 isoform X2 [Ctenopharyngodon idella]|uniref:UDP-glucuronosyltransferase 1A5 isoform X2 n=1 Tax=Ctenopharyngodon idella TaxID=7959 RepID=UPI0022305BC3|nr:UDP-glucuronosyltransferase 1A5 isoform X2 [Ctenopharyngodon idella]